MGIDRRREEKGGRERERMSRLIERILETDCCCNNIYKPLVDWFIVHF